jgi:hypothetical protein
VLYFNQRRLACLFILVKGLSANILVSPDIQGAGVNPYPLSRMVVGTVVNLRYRVEKTLEGKDSWNI